MWPLIRLAAVVTPAAAIGYVIACIFYPFAACRRCEGAGKFRTSSRKAWRKCRRCKGSGERLRLGRKLYNRWRNLPKDAT